MKFTLATVVTALSVLNAVDAARIDVLVHRGSGFSTILVNDDGDGYDFGNFIDGCKSNTHFWLRQFCMDKANMRAHVTYTSGVKYCFKRTKINPSPSGYPNNIITKWDFTKTACNW